MLTHSFRARQRQMLCVASLESARTLQAANGAAGLSLDTRRPGFGGSKPTIAASVASKVNLVATSARHDLDRLLARFETRSAEHQPLQHLGFVLRALLRWRSDPPITSGQQRWIPGPAPPTRDPVGPERTATAPGRRTLGSGAGEHDPGPDRARAGGVGQGIEPLEKRSELQVAAVQSGSPVTEQRA